MHACVQVVSVRAVKEYCNLGVGSTDVTLRVLEDQEAGTWWHAHGEVMEGGVGGVEEEEEEKEGKVVGAGNVGGGLEEEGEIVEVGDVDGGKEEGEEGEGRHDRGLDV